MRLLCRVVAAVLALASAPAFAQGTFPDRAVRIVVSAAAGGGTDIIARLVAQELSAMWKQPVVVENKTGAGGNIAAQFVARAKPDGYTLLVTYAGAITINPHLYLDMGFDPDKDLAPITNLASSPMYVVANPKVMPARTPKEFIAFAKASPHPMNWASTAKGSPDHLAGETIAVLAGVKLSHVPYKGGADGIVDVLAGRVPVGIFTPPTAQAYVKAGQLVAVGGTGKTRSAMFPDVETFAEAGFTELDVATWYGVWAPAGIPPAVRDKIATDIRAVLKHDAIVKRTRELGMEIVGNSPGEFTVAIKEETDRYGKIVKAVGLPKN